MSTAIQWTDVTDNIIVVDGGGWWCRKISEGCAHCYAAELNQNYFFGGNHRAYSGEAPKLVLREDVLASWASQRVPKKHFVASMTDVFGEWVAEDWIFKFLDAMRAAPRQTFQVLTKRADLMRLHVRTWLGARGLTRVPANIWLGVSVENQKAANLRIPELLQIPCAVRFLSVEPILENIDLDRLDMEEECRICHEAITASVFSQAEHCSCCVEGDEPIAWYSLQWVIVGGESGRKARVCDVNWIRSIVQQCADAEVACFVKQLGTRPVMGREDSAIVRDKKGGNMEEWPADLRVREFPKFEQKLTKGTEGEG